MSLTDEKNTNRIRHIMKVTQTIVKDIKDRKIKHMMLWKPDRKRKRGWTQRKLDEWHRRRTNKTKRLRRWEILKMAENPELEDVERCKLTENKTINTVE